MKYPLIGMKRPLNELQHPLNETKNVLNQSKKTVLICMYCYGVYFFLKCVYIMYACLSQSYYYYAVTVIIFVLLEYIKFEQYSVYMHACVHVGGYMWCVFNFNKCKLK